MEQKQKQIKTPKGHSNLNHTGHMQLGGVQSETGIYAAEEQNGEDNGKIGNQGPDLKGRRGGKETVG